MARLILVTGSGGAGKTVVASATGLAASRRGVRTGIVSFGLSQGLVSTFGLEEPLFPSARGQPVRINEHLDIQELDVQEELRRGWSHGRGSLAALLGEGLENVSAEEVAITPGLEELVTLLRLSELLREQRYELLIVDCPSTTGALRLVSSASALGWYARRPSSPARKARSGMLTARSCREPGALQEARDRLAAVDELLRDPAVTTLRLVATSGKVSVQETQRAYTYFSLYGVTTDCVVINRLAPGGEGAQQPHVEKLQRVFAPLPVLKTTLHSSEVVGEGPLEAFMEQLYQGEDPVLPMVSQPPLGFSKEGVDAYRLELKLPFTTKDDIDISRREEELVVRVGAVRRNILLPRMMALLPTAGARMEGDRLIMSFRKERGG
ncbi:Arsenical pump-driving ATPase [Cystobacter fuscus DSM 2262]|uniref:arsenite-transporting ATPase n=1 Tax=Cystobacter fuscus (strain ATCC 25194 / DSM 2262 / NBRC 100088 / M29) TaxID=1242864 RepID=S9Q1S1_CYSF2|nr:ArsA family ATPase [Cystobacter fuscus]EPX55244.1 Arsenical pump-driving ATPase [Cystobacter fuscus DSM 2262]